MIWKFSGLIISLYIYIYSKSFSTLNDTRKFRWRNCLLLSAIFVNYSLFFIRHSFEIFQNSVKLFLFCLQINYFYLSFVLRFELSFNSRRDFISCHEFFMQGNFLEFFSHIKLLGHSCTLVGLVEKASCDWFSTLVLSRARISVTSLTSHLI
jgi:hypothetical protein